MKKGKITARLCVLALIFLFAVQGGSLFAGGGQQKNQAASATGPLSGEIRFTWWGNEERNEATLKVISAYEALHPGVKITPEYSGYDGVYNKLMSQIAGGNAPDVFTLSAEWLAPVVSQKAALNVTNLLDVSTHNPEVNKSCSIDGVLYGANISLNANVVYFNKTLADELGIKVPTGSYTWDDLIRICAEAYMKSGGKVYGMQDPRMQRDLQDLIPVWNITHLGKEPPFPWTDKEMIMTGQDVANFMDYFGKLPAGVILPPAESVNLQQQDLPFLHRKTLMGFQFASWFGYYQGMTKDELVMIEYPHDGKGKGAAVFAKPGLITCVYANSKNPRVAVDFINYLANDPEVGKTLKSVRGVLPSTSQRNAVLSSPGILTDTDQKVFSIVGQIYDKTVNPYFAGPAGTYDLFDRDLLTVGEEVGYGRLTPAQAGARFEELKKDLGR
ncbi:sugar ABC transporter substrate-binding protein [Spirochaetia bacterium]|nr:sugar ABC transporter substrate-binding protein [Spirochaetia bacterium]